MPCVHVQLCSNSQILRHNTENPVGATKQRVKNLIILPTLVFFFINNLIIHFKNKQQLKMIKMMYTELDATRCSEVFVM